ncbi:MAG: GntR family transcriptional regulator [Tardiphaga sp.]|jgi:DNA-binding GntR family transcriptional regulator|nr:GntR family transcriptional regulator [Tardiphaga sp.]
MAKKSTSAPAPALDLGQDTYLRLKEAIRDGTFKVGDRLTELDLAARLKVSRTPVREAMHRLEADGLLCYEPRRGVTVARPDHQMIIELYVMREALEGTAAGLAAQHASAIEVAALAELIEGESAYLTDGAELSRINQRIHRLVYFAAHNRYLLRSLSSVADTMTLLPTMLGNIERAKEAHEEHLGLLAAIRAKDPAAAETAARHHLRSAQRHRLSWLLRHDPQLDGGSSS